MQNNFKYFLFCISLLFFCLNTNAQKDTNKWKALFAFGVNSPASSGFVVDGNAKTINLPTVNIGLQHMFTRQYGAKLDFGFNRFTNDTNVQDFKINYSRINAQFVLNISELIGISNRMQFLLHAGPGYSFVKPLAGLGFNKQSYLNFMGGLELHYAINEKVSIFTDLSYIYGFTSLDNYDPTISGLGAFNGNITTLTFGVALSLSGCYTCN